MARPSTRAELIQYCLRSLGEPVLQVNVDDDQVEDRIDEAIQYWQEYHSDAVVRTFVKHKLTAQDVENQYIQLPEALISIFRIFQINKSAMTGTDMFSLKYQMHMSDMFSLRHGGSLIDYELMKQHMALVDITMGGLCQQVTFSRHMNRLMIEVNWSESNLVEGAWIILEGYQTIDPNAYPDVYNDIMLKRYAKQLIKRQWGENLIKMEGLQMPGGVTLNAARIYEDANTEIQKMEEEFDSKWSYPPDFYCG
jgi:hypothetical protein